MYNQPQPWQNAGTQPQQTAPPVQQPAPQPAPSQPAPAPQQPAPEQPEKKSGKLKIVIIILIVLVLLGLFLFFFVVPLMVVGLTLQVVNQGSGIPEQTARTSWKSASPFAIVDWSKNAAGTMTIVLKNNSYEDLNLESFILDSSTASTEKVTNLAPGATMPIALKSAPCATGAKYSYPKEGIKIIYRSTSMQSDRTETAIADIVGSCN